MPARPVAAAFLLAAASLPFVPDLLESQTLRGSRAALVRVHDHATGNGLYFFRTPEGIRRAVADGRLVPLPGNANYRVHNVSYPYALPAARTFVERLAAQYRSACGEQLVVTSATRPLSMRLVNGSDLTVHPTGMAIDLRKPQNPRCLRWLRTTLLQLERSGVVVATEEFRPPHFHVAILPAPYTRYVQQRGGSIYAAATSVGPSRAGGQADRHRVRSGDSLWRIARQYQTSVSAIKAANGLRSETVRVGQELVIPGR